MVQNLGVFTSQKRGWGYLQANLEGWGYLRANLEGWGYLRANLESWGFYEPTGEKAESIKSWRLKSSSPLASGWSRSTIKKSLNDNWVFSDVNLEGGRCPSTDGLDKMWRSTCFSQSSSTPGSHRGSTNVLGEKFPQLTHEPAARRYFTRLPQPELWFKCVEGVTG